MSTVTVNIFTAPAEPEIMFFPVFVADPEPEPFVDNSGTLSDEQRIALFAAWNKVFGSSANGARYIFTNLVLGNDENTQVSWSTWKPGALTRLQAEYLLKSLRSLEAAL